MFDFYKSANISIQFYEENSLLRANWFPESEEMTEEVLKKELLYWANGIKQFLPTRLLVDSRQFIFTISPSMQIWMAENIYPFYTKNEVKKQAFLVSHDFIARISIMQGVQEVGSIITESQYFVLEKEAFSWLLKEVNHTS
ncbi:MAG: hypothetical protein KTR26_15535 [Flammeovirgaceae bacterium]|nr:hypothetical protein [Flammeovirgaceae bacterium]